MRFPYIFSILVAFLPGLTSKPCVKNGFLLNFEAHECNFRELFKAFRDFFLDPINDHVECDHGPKRELLLLLGAIDSSEGRQKVKALCKTAFDNYPKTSFSQVLSHTDEFIGNFFEGGTWWNEQVETIFDSDGNRGSSQHVLQEDVGQIMGAYIGVASNGILQWPSDLVEDLFDSECDETNSAYCCWVSDRQPDDGSGYCMVEPDVHCVNSDPAPNTDLCFAQPSKLSKSERGGFFHFPGPREGPVHCHGFSWSEDPSYSSNVFKGNSLLAISMADHLYSRGYVRSIPGSPMCACAEKMPAITRADCTEVSANLEFRFAFDGQSFLAQLTDIQLSFIPCQGTNSFGRAEINSLWAKMNDLFQKGHLSTTKFQHFNEHVVGFGNCDAFTQSLMATSFDKVKGFEHDETEWLQVAGNGVLLSHLNPEMEGFNALFKSSRNGIIRRVCITCGVTHQNIFYKRLSPIPLGWNLLESLKNSRQPEPAQGYGADFLLFSTYQDAKNGSNPWICDYKAENGFPGDCGPHGSLAYQDTLFHSLGGSRKDVGFFIDSTAPLTVTSLDSSFVDIGQRLGSPGSAFQFEDRTYVTSTGTDIGLNNDGFTFQYVAINGDATLSTKLESFHSLDNQWAKAGIMIRQDLNSPNGMYFSLLVTSGKGIQINYRDEVNSNSMIHSVMENWDTFPLWLMITKRSTIFAAFISDDGENWAFHGEYHLALTSNLFGGFALAAHYKQTPAEAVHSGLIVESHQWLSTHPTSSPAPSVILTSDDIGGQYPDMIGTSSYHANSALWTLRGAGSGIWGTYDSFHYVHYAQTEDVTITVSLEHLDTQSDWGKGGIMIRDDLDPQAKHVAVALTGLHGVYMEYRDEAQVTSTSIGCCTWLSGETSSWLRLEKRGPLFIGYKSQSGLHWEAIGTAEVSLDNPTYFIGMALTSSDIEVYAYAQFRDFHSE